MSDIVERLRAFPPGDGEGGLFHDAADEIERLEDALKTCRELREYDRVKIAQLKALLEKANTPLWDKHL